MPTRAHKETEGSVEEAAFEDRYKRERDRRYRQLVHEARRIDFPFDPARIDDAMGFFLSQYPQYAEPLADPVVLIENANDWKNMFLIEAGTGTGRALRLVYARRMDKTNIPRTKIEFLPNLFDLLLCMFEKEEYESLNAYRKIKHDEKLNSNDYLEIADFLIKKCPMFEKKGLESVKALVRQLPIRDSNYFTVRTAAPQPYLNAGFEDIKPLLIGADPFQAKE